MSDAAALLVGFGLTGAAMSAWVKSLVQRPMVRQMKRSLAIEPEHAGDGYRDARRTATVSIDGHERPLGDLRRVSVEREITVRVNGADGITHPVTAVAVALLFDESMVQVARASAVDDAVGRSARSVRSRRASSGRAMGRRRAVVPTQRDAAARGVSHDASAADGHPHD